MASEDVVLRLQRRPRHAIRSHGKTALRPRTGPDRDRSGSNQKSRYLSNRLACTIRQMSGEVGISGSEDLSTRRRGDIQGLRAVAVLLVVLDHAGVRALKGGYVGVDVFFVLSGYLITGVLVSSAERANGRSYFSDFYARRARRILPAATLTLAVTCLAAWQLLNLYRAHQVLVDSLYCTFFVANFHFASIGTNYFAMGQPSPLQNFWSLSVEEQFYLVWPWLVGVAVVGISLRGRSFGGMGGEPSRRALHSLGLVAVLITAASLAYAVHDTHHSATAAYFSSPARAWELGLGAVLLLNVHRIARLSPAFLAALGWLGIAGIIAASTLYSASTLFPGLPALLPTVGAAAVIAAGLHLREARFAPSRVLSLLPFRYVGDRSYALYLWHWPVLILASEHVDHSLSLTTNLLLVAGAFVLSIITYGLFENPIHHSARLQGAAGLVLWPAAIAAVLFVTSLNWSQYKNAVNAAQSAALATPLTIGAQATTQESNTPVDSGWRPSSPSALVTAVGAVRKASPIPSPLTPPALSLPSDHLFELPRGCIAEMGEVHGSSCSVPGTSGERSLMLVGDSHAQMWLPAIVHFAQEEGYEIRPYIHLGCNPWRWAGVERVKECSAWYSWIVAQARALRPTLLMIVTHYDTAPVEVTETKYVGLNSIANISAFASAVRSTAGQIVVIGDPPGQEKEPVDCLVKPHATMATCSNSPTAGQIETDAGVESATKAFGAFLDTTPWLCFDNICPMVVGHTTVYVSHDHITETYAEELAPLFSAGLKRVLAGKLAQTSRLPLAPTGKLGHGSHFSRSTTSNAHRRRTPRCKAVRQCQRRRDSSRR